MSSSVKYWYALKTYQYSICIGGRDIKYFCCRYPISDIDIALSDIGKKFVVLKAFSLISDQSDNETD
jgi:hypothetical protein